MGSYHGMTLKSVTEGNQPKKPIAAVQPMPPPQPSLSSSVSITSNYYFKSNSSFSFLSFL